MDLRKKIKLKNDFSETFSSFGMKFGKKKTLRLLNNEVLESILDFNHPCHFCSLVPHRIRTWPYIMFSITILIPWVNSLCYI